MYETINGYPIIATYHTPSRGGNRPGRIILVDRGKDSEERYVVAWQCFHDSHGPQWDSSWSASCYYQALKGARREFFRRVEREPEGA